MVSGAVRDLYKRLLFVGREYPGEGGLAAVRSKAKVLFQQCPAGSSAEHVQQALKRGEFILKELEALVKLHKYRTLRKRRFRKGHESPQRKAAFSTLQAALPDAKVAAAVLLPPIGQAETAAQSVLQEMFLQHGWQFYALEGLMVGVLLVVASFYNYRPRGWSNPDFLEVRESAVHAKGVFAKQHIPAGKLLGSYPGHPRTPQAMIAKCKTTPEARDYAFLTQDGYFLDPTDRQGIPCAYPRPGMPWLGIDPTLAFVNEPPLGQSVNVEVIYGRQVNDMWFVAERDINQGEELFIDYGASYDRSHYE
ncbi:hypothetical protein WJX72_008280 [[Myrmecia] bisecta]|uniref:SET domain-containing protein n=1 Tax=[Myrmecia] bisecta TaxID=41462 RepID=A0AAW1R8A2_9CHLO